MTTWQLALLGSLLLVGIFCYWSTILLCFAMITLLLVYSKPRQNFASWITSPSGREQLQSQQNILSSIWQVFVSPVTDLSWTEYDLMLFTLYDIDPSKGIVLGVCGQFFWLEQRSVHVAKFVRWSKQAATQWQRVSYGSSMTEPSHFDQLEQSEQYRKQGQKYRTEKSWNKAAASFQQAADAISHPVQKAKYTADAIRCHMEQKDYSMAKNQIEGVCELITDAGAFDLGGRLSKEFAAKFRDVDAIVAMTLYQQAISMFECASQPEAMVGCQEELADMYAHQLYWPQAKQLYETIANHYINQEIAQAQSSKLLFNAILCCLAMGDVSLVKQQWEVYIRLEFRLQDSMYERFIYDLLEAWEEGNPVALASTTHAFDDRYGLQDWQVNALLLFRNHLESGDLT